MTDSLKRYECGTLRYTLGGVVIACALIMLGFFCMNFAGAAVGGLIPLQLKSLGAGDTQIAFIMTTIGGIFNITVCPAVSFKSDRYRGKRWGRRCVFIIGTLPMYCAALFLFAGASGIGGYIAGLLKGGMAVAPATVTIVVIGIIMVMYQFFYMFVASVIFYIYNDVIPAQFLARVVGMTQVVSVGAAAVFNFFFFQYAETHFSALMILVSVTYAAGTGLMCFFLKEPKYLPLTEEESRQSRGIEGILTFLKESFSHPFYWYAFLGCAFNGVALAISTFLIFFYRNMGLDLVEIGSLNGISGIAGMFMSLILATAGSVFIDRWHPMRIYIFGSFLMLLIPVVQCKWIFFSPGGTLFYWVYLSDNIATLFITYIVAMATLPMLMRAFPKSRFGQFCSAQAMLRSVIVLIFGFLLGVAIDFGRRYISDGEEIYRYLWGWRLLWSLLGMGFLLLMYREWMRLGGYETYRAPAPWSPEKFETLDHIPVAAPSVKTMKIALMIWDFIILLYVLTPLAFSTILSGWQTGTDLFRFRYYAVPASLLLPAVWIPVRLLIRRRVEQAQGRTGKICGVPHHGILFLAAIQQGLLLGVALMQSWLAIDDDPGTSAFYWIAESFSCLLVVLMFAAIMRLERSKDQYEI